MKRNIDTTMPVDEQQSAKRTATATPTQERKNTSTINSTTTTDTSSVLANQDIHTFMKNLPSEIVNIIDTYYQDLRFFKLLRLLRVKIDAMDWEEIPPKYDGYLPPSVYNSMESMLHYIYECGPDSVPGIYQMDLDDNDDDDEHAPEHTVIYIAIRFGESGGDGHVNGYFDSKTLKPLIIDDQNMLYNRNQYLVLPSDLTMEDWMEYHARGIASALSEMYH